MRGEGWRRSLRAGEAAGLFLATLLLYIGVPGGEGGVDTHPFLNWDDNFYIIQNPTIRALSWESLRAWWTQPYFGNYAPVHLASYGLEYALRGGPVEGGFHLTDAVLHAGSALFALLLFRRLVGPGLPALMAAALFAFHPVQVESVAWASQRKSTLAMFFLLPAIILFLRHRDQTPGGAKGRWPTAAYFCSLAFFALSLLSKGMGVVLPVLLLLIEWLLDPRPRRAARFPEIAPYFGLALVLGLATVWAQSGAGAVHVERHDLSFLLTMVVVFSDYVRLLFLPLNLNNLYYPEAVKGVLQGEFLGALALLAAVLGLAAAWARRAPRLAFWALWFFICLGPVSNLLPLTVLKADRYLYLPSLALGGLVAEGLLRLPQRRRAIGAVAAALLVVCFATLTGSRVPVWQSAERLWTDSVAKAPASHVAWGSLGEVYFGRGEYGPARKAYEKAVGHQPRYGRGYFNLGFIAVREGRMKDAAKALVAGLRVAPEPPPWNPVERASYGFIHFYIAVQDAAEGRLAEAESGYRRALGYRPAFPEGWYNLGLVLGKQGRPTEAYKAFVKAGALRKDFYEAHREAGLAAMRGGATGGEARRALERALVLRPEGPDAAGLRSRLDAPVVGAKGGAVDPGAP